MSLTRKASAIRPPKTGYSHLAKTAVQETTLRVKEMHGAIACTAFGLVRRIPGISRPAQVVQAAHDAIAGGVYAAIHHGSGGLLTAAAIIEKHHTAYAPYKATGRLTTGLRSALNGVFGDHLAARNNLLAIDMAIHVGGAALSLDRDSLRRAFPEAGRRLCVFVHGLACDEHCWETGKRAAHSETHFGRQLQADFDYTPLYVRYNTGLPIAENAAQLAVLLEELLAAWPHPADELAIVGHSMGGLVALGACEHATTARLQWPRLTRVLVCLGSPQLGSPLERLGHLATSALKLSRITFPLGKIAAARSRGIKDLRRGPGAVRTLLGPHRIAFRFLGASLAADVDHPLGRFLGDGLVPLTSATAHDADGDVQSVRLGKLGHMRLLNDKRVYRQISEWLTALDGNGMPQRR